MLFLGIAMNIRNKIQQEGFIKDSFKYPVHLVLEVAIVNLINIASRIEANSKQKY